MKLVNIYFFNLLFLSFTVAEAQVASVSALGVAGSMTWGSYKQAVLPPSDTPLPLPNKELTDADKRIAKMADSMFERHTAALGVLLIEKGKIIYERYREPGTPTSPMFSYSMSKTLVGDTIGQMMCGGVIGELDKPASTYSKDLEGTVYGEATVKNLLTMSSGVAAANMNGEHKGGQWGSLARGWSTNLSLIKEFKDRGKTFFGNPLKSGEDFNYSNIDTTALSNIADNNGGFVENFDKYIWSQIGAENKGYWMLGTDNKVVAYSGFSATDRDWGRLAIFSISQLKSNNACINNYMKEATSRQISNSKKLQGKLWHYYGYQQWIGNYGSHASYWWVGFAGQRVAIDPVSERIIVVSSHVGNYGVEIFNLFGAWQRIPTN
jgi:CubicO group peptidase (beta-lactamase class C family)